jgi:hypothetical protein
MAFIKKHFSLPQPNFGRSKLQKSLEPYKNSVYYLWWRFLQLNEDYPKCCKNGGSGKMKQIYADFGNIFASDFKTWWQTGDLGAELFAEQLPPEFKVISASEASDREAVLIVQVPLTLPKRYLASNFQKILNAHHSGRRGVRTNKLSSAKYPITGHVDTAALQKCLRVYELRLADPKKQLWKVAQEAKAASPKNYIIDEKTEHKSVQVAKKLILANTAKRLLNRAQRIIKGTSMGMFPLVQNGTVKK